MLTSFHFSIFMHKSQIKLIDEFLAYIYIKGDDHSSFNGIIYLNNCLLLITTGMYSSFEIEGHMVLA